LIEKMTKDKEKDIESQLEEEEDKEIGVKIGSWLDFAGTVSTVISNKQNKVNEIIKHCEELTQNEKSISPLLSDKLKATFKRRQRHHIGKMLDGIIKLNHLDKFNTQIKYLLKNREEKREFEINPTDQDIADCNEIMGKILRSWVQ